jgi:hypothetical protein
MERLNIKIADICPGLSDGKADELPVSEKGQVGDLAVDVDPTLYSDAVFRCPWGDKRVVYSRLGDPMVEVYGPVKIVCRGCKINKEGFEYLTTARIRKKG